MCKTFFPLKIRNRWPKPDFELDSKVMQHFPNGAFLGATAKLASSFPETILDPLVPVIVILSNFLAFWNPGWALEELWNACDDVLYCRMMYYSVKTLFYRNSVNRYRFPEYSFHKRSIHNQHTCRPISEANSFHCGASSCCDGLPHWSVLKS